MEALINFLFKGESAAVYKKILLISSLVIPGFLFIVVLNEKWINELSDVKFIFFSVLISGSIFLINSIFLSLVYYKSIEKKTKKEKNQYNFNESFVSEISFHSIFMSMILLIASMVLKIKGIDFYIFASYVHIIYYSYYYCAKNRNIDIKENLKNKTSIQLKYIIMFCAVLIISTGIFVIILMYIDFGCITLNIFKNLTN
jgi:hypothetical protein